ncbi:Hypothetical predicted protein, partial [Pelobates cultripes]
MRAVSRVHVCIACTLASFACTPGPRARYTLRMRLVPMRQLQFLLLRSGFRVCAAHAQLTSDEFARFEHARIGGDVRYDVTRLFKRQSWIKLLPDVLIRSLEDLFSYSSQFELRLYFTGKSKK